MKQRVVASLAFLFLATIFCGMLYEHTQQMRILTRAVEASIRQVDEVCDRQDRAEQAAAGTRDELAGRLDAIDRRGTPDVEGLYEDVIHPSVQVSGRSGVGGGVIIHSRGASKEDSETYVVTAFHVIQKVVRKEDGLEVRDPMEVRFYKRDGTYDHAMQGELVVYDEKQDLALVRVAGTGLLPNVAKLASRETIAAVRVFTPVYAVGCPLGHDPLPSAGEISTLHKEVNGARFWMMNAPTIFGNSGGGIFHRETRELLGVSAMICTYDNQGSTPVPHLGIMVSLETVYDWLDQELYQFVYDARFTSEECARARQGAGIKSESEPLKPSRTARAGVEW